MRTIKANALALTLLLGAVEAGAANLVVNGDFESQTVANTATGFDTFSDASQGLAGWTINLNTVDLVSSSLWSPAGGNNSLDLNGLRKGVISQVISTVAGQVYTLSFDLAGNPFGSTPVKGLSVNFGSTGLFNFDTSRSTKTNMGWTRYTVEFAAESAETTLSFASRVNGNAGPALDNISVNAVPEPETYAMMLAGLGLMAGMVRRRKPRRAV